MPERSDELELTALESALRDLRPHGATLDRAVLMYNAGRAAARGWRWPLATALVSALALGLGIALLVRPGPTVNERVVYVRVPVVEPTNSEPEIEGDPPIEAGEGSWTRYLLLQEQVLNRGLDGVPPPRESAKPPTVESVLNPL
jgi:hypothetical protein